MLPCSWFGRMENNIMCTLYSPLCLRTLEFKVMLKSFGKYCKKLARAKKLKSNDQNKIKRVP